MQISLYYTGYANHILSMKTSAYEYKSRVLSETIELAVIKCCLNASSFDIGLVTDEVEIPLEEVKPVFIRSVFMEEDRMKDVIGISKALDTYLIDASSGQTSRGIIFVDVHDYENAYSITGQYALEGDNVALRGNIFKGNDDKLGDFKLVGNENQLEDMAESIFDEVLKIIASQH